MWSVWRAGHNVVVFFTVTVNFLGGLKGRYHCQLTVGLWPLYCDADKKIMWLTDLSNHVMVQRSGNSPNNTKILGLIPDMARACVHPLIHHHWHSLYERMKNKLNTKCIHSSLMLWTASLKHSFNVMTHLKQLHSSITLFVFLQEGTKDPPQTAETLNTSCTTTLQTGRRKRKVPSFIPFLLRSATMPLMSLKPSICQPVLRLQSHDLIW